MENPPKVTVLNRTVPYHAVEKHDKIAVETKYNSIKLAFWNIRSQFFLFFLINDLITTNNLDFMFLNKTWLENTCSATVLN